MIVLLLAPQPFFTERGTPIAVRAVAEALCRQGHEVDILAFCGGVDIVAPGLRIFRSPRPPFVRKVPIGFSVAKLASDLLLLVTAARMMQRRRYDVIHAVEETIYPALLAKLVSRVAVVQDVDSLLVDQLVEKWPRLAQVRAPLDWVERFAMRRADLVLGVCPRVVEHIRREAPGQTVHLLPDIATPPPSGAPPADVWNLRALVGEDSGPIALYVGNLESYQGVDLLIAAMAAQPPDARPCRLVVIGGNPDDVRSAQAQVVRLCVADCVLLTGPAPLAHLPWLLGQADILCSPRRRGVNTPMKIYNYMAAARPILATRIVSHTQVLDDGCALLVDPTAEALAGGIAVLAANSAHGQMLGRTAARIAQDLYGPASFEERVRRAYATLAPRPRPRSRPNRAAVAQKR